MLKTGAVAIALLAAGAADTGVRKLGNAIVEYRDRDVHAVIAYEYSQRSHDGRWILVQAAITTRARVTIHPKDFEIRTERGDVVPMATEERFILASAEIRNIQQNARVWDRQLANYFVESPLKRWTIFKLPGEGVVDASLESDSYGPSLLTLYFESPGQSWKAGAYQLTIDNGRVKAVLPIELK